MEIIIVGLVLVSIVAYYLISKNKEVEMELLKQEKVETAPVVEAQPEPVVGRSEEDRVEATAPVVAEPVELPTPVVPVSVEWPMTARAEGAKKKAAPKKPSVKAPVKSKAPAKPKATPKPKAPAMKATPKPKKPKATK